MLYLLTGFLAFFAYCARRSCLKLMKKLLQNQCPLKVHKLLLQLSRTNGAVVEICILGALISFKKTNLNGGSRTRLMHILHHSITVGPRRSPSLGLQAPAGEGPLCEIQRERWNVALKPKGLPFWICATLQGQTLKLKKMKKLRTPGPLHSSHVHRASTETLHSYVSFCFEMAAEEAAAADAAALEMEKQARSLIGLKRRVPIWRANLIRWVSHIDHIIS